MIFCAPTAFTTSLGDSPLACSSGTFQVDLDLTLFSAIYIRDCNARNGHQTGTNEIVGHVINLLFVEVIAGQCKLQNRNGRALYAII